MNDKSYESRRDVLYIDGRSVKALSSEELKQQSTQYGDWYSRRVASNELKYRENNEQDKELQEV